MEGLGRRLRGLVAAKCAYGREMEALESEGDDGDEITRHGYLTRR